MIKTHIEIKISELKDMVSYLEKSWDDSANEKEKETLIKSMIDTTGEIEELHRLLLTIGRIS